MPERYRDPEKSGLGYLMMTQDLDASPETFWNVDKVLGAAGLYPGTGSGAQFERLAKGEDFLKRYRFLAPDQANPYDSLGELYANTGRYEEAETNLTKALAIKPDFFPSHGHLGTMRYGKGDFKGA